MVRKLFRTPRILAVILLAVPAVASAQSDFDAEAYKRFLQSNEELTGPGLMNRHDAGLFRARAAGTFDDAQYAADIDKHYHLTGHEKDLISRHGFMVTERLRYKDFGTALLEIYNRDLPVYISSDAILHALHRSYDDILVELERSTLIPALDSLLGAMHRQMPLLDARYGGEPGMRASLSDLDLYLTVSRALLHGDSTQLPHYPANAVRLSELWRMIAALQPNGYQLFAEAARTIDFSQFTVRGHYTQSAELGNYFRAMIWLGRTELQMVAPLQPGSPTPPWRDMQRQFMLALLVNEAVQNAGAEGHYRLVDGTLGMLVGESDNITLDNLRSFTAEQGLADVRELLDSTRFAKFQSALRTKSYAFQRINSQILMSDPMSPEQIVPASAFLLLGQRFIIDSYVTGEVVYDKLKYKGQKVMRMLPQMLDILFVLGNDGAAQLLRDEMNRYHYAPTLAALRYLVNSYEPGFWDGTVYNGWLNAIRSLNPPADRGSLPPFMQTAAWWQKTMNTQLASWAQLRHDNLLYAKQSYSGGVGCSYPKALVEPVPAFYEAVGRYARNAGQKIGAITGIPDTHARARMVRYFNRMEGIMDTLAGIARKELADAPLNNEERRFLQWILFERSQGCATEMTGWYAELFYGGESGLVKEDLVVADVHTAPTDADGNTVGWVVHGGTGPLDMAVITCRMPEGESVAFIGPVMSYYEHVSTNFKRLTDEEWKSAHAAAPSFRPQFTELYLAGPQGDDKGGTVSLLTGADEAAVPPAPAKEIAVKAYPTPFTASTLIALTVPEGAGANGVQATVYDASGTPVAVLHDRPLPAGTFTLRWDGTNTAGARVASGTYFCVVRYGDHQTSVPLTFEKR